ncbi:DUF4352 domain-containing protein [Sebaldella sp. S0638]|uniref:DUF4352 domain-containing protein n=1 Tax=Sebaldella sp. S0638 TaxID=2957809 RepID=UPI00209ED4B0|nr:DUF4352 domain-containing protein [Sebaldella sp. S0638]
MKRKKILIAGVIFLVVLAAGSIGYSFFSRNYKKVKTYEVGEKQVKHVRFNKPFFADHFEVTILKTSLTDSLKNDSKILLKKEEGVEYFVIDVKVKNENSESKNLPDSGSILLGEAEYMIEIEENIKLTEAGYGVFSEQIKPGESKESKIVFRIPVEYGDEAIIWDVFGSGVKIRLQ